MGLGRPTQAPNHDPGRVGLWALCFRGIVFNCVLYRHLQSSVGFYRGRKGFGGVGVSHWETGQDVGAYGLELEV